MKKFSVCLVFSLMGLFLSSCATFYTVAAPNSIEGHFYKTTKRLSSISNLPDYGWRYKLLPTNEIVFQWNHDELGAVVSVSEGLVAQTSNDDELAVLIGQGMAHITLNHPNSSRFTFYDDKRIREADRLGMAYAAKAKYNPQVAKQLWLRLAKKYSMADYVGFHWTAGREETYVWNIEPILRLYRGRLNETVH